MIEWLLRESGSISELIALLTAIAGAVLWMVRMFSIGRKRVEALFTQQEGLKSSLNEITAQLKPNGGSSMFDMVKYAHKQSIENNNSIAAIVSAVDRIHAFQWSFVETLADKPIWESDANGNCIRVNGALAKLAERNATEFSDSGWENIVHPSDRERVFEEWSSAVKRRRAFESTYRIRSKGGKVHSVKAVALPVFTEGGDFVSYVGRYDEVIASE